MLAVPIPLPDMDVEVTLTVQPVAEKDALLTATERGWPPGFFESTFGSLKDDPIERGPQGNYEAREALD